MGIFRHKCWCGSGLEAGFCSHRSTVRQAETGRPTKLQRAVKAKPRPKR